MKILLVAPESILFPVGICYISASLKKAGHDVTCINLKFTKNIIPFFNEKYDFLATGGLTLQYQQIKDIIQQAKNHNIKVIAGGGIISSEPEFMSRKLEIDYAVIGEGEITINELLSCLEDHEDLSRVNGIGYFQEGKFFLTEPRKEIENIDLIPFPDYEGFNLEQALEKSKSSDFYYLDIFDYPREYPIISSRSCPFSCTFCYHPIGKKYRQRSIDSIIEELKIVIPKYKINIVSILDELFSYYEPRVYEFCQKFKAFTDTLPWEVKWNCQMRVDRINEEMLDTMKESGCYYVSYGFESYNPTVLKSMKKAITPQQIHNTIHTTLKKHISLQGNFIFGDRAETLRTAKETLRFWKKHREAGIMLTYIIPVPNSEIYQYCIKKGIIKESIEVFKKISLGEIINFTSMNKYKFCYLRLLIHKANKYLVTSFPERITSTSLTIKCPFCSSINEYKNFEIPSKYFSIMKYCRNCRYRFFVVSRKYKLFQLISDIPKRLMIIYSCLVPPPLKSMKNPAIEQIIMKLGQIPILKYLFISFTRVSD